MAIYIGNNNINPGVSKVYVGSTLVYQRNQPQIDYLCFTAEEANSVVAFCKSNSRTIGAENTAYSTDGVHWTPMTLVELNYSQPSTAIILANVGDKVYFKNKLTSDFDWNWNHLQFWFSGKVAASGNINSIVDDVNFNSSSLQLPEGCFNNLFNPVVNYESLTSAPRLPATNLSNKCYQFMFDSCRGIRVAPELPAIIMKDDCYKGMFQNCKALLEAPELPAMTLADNCYFTMFMGCTGLLTPCALPAMTLASYCYYGMFDNCRAMNKIPALPATTLATRCYGYMFYYCSEIYVSKNSGRNTYTFGATPTSDTHSDMFRYTGGDFTQGTPSKTMYTSNTIV